MSGDDRIRDAFRDLNDRVARDIDPAIDPSARAAAPPPTRPALLSRPVLAIAGLIVVVGAGATAIGLARSGDDDQQVATDSVTTTAEGDDTGSTADPGSDEDGPVSTDEPTTDGESGDDTDASVDEGQRLRVDTELVSADTADPFLNVRGDPDARSDLVAKLPANYTGLRATGETETAEDGGTWIRVELLHPVAVSAFAIDDERRPTGWVNQAFVLPLPDGLAVGPSELPACDDGVDGFGVDGRLGDGHVYAIESARLTDDCIRVILTFGAGRAPIGWLDLPEDTGPAAAVPTMRTLSSGGFGSSIDLGPITSTWSNATETGDVVYLVRTDDGTIDLVVPTPSEIVAVSARPEIGAVVIDLRFRGEAPPSGAGVVLTRPLSPSSGTIDVVGLARPFEAVLGATVEDADGRPVEAVFSGNVQLGTQRTTEYGVAATDWAETWGSFALRVEGLAAGRYTLVLDAEGAGEDPEVLRLPFTLDEGGPPPTLASDADQEAARALIRFAVGGDIDDVPLADEVTLLLGPEIYSTTTAGALADPDAWTASAPDGFGGFEGPFSPLLVLDPYALRLTAGAVPHCAGPPRDWPDDLDGLRQVNIEPVGIDSCIAWFGVHLFLDDDDRIAAVSIDRFGP